MSTATRAHAAGQGILRAVFAGPIRALHSPRQPDARATRWRSAILKSRQESPVHVGQLGLTGDSQKEKKHHGGPTRAVLVYSATHYRTLWDDALGPHALAHAAALRAMSSEVDAGAYGFGAFGENLTVDGLDEHLVFLGDLWRIGECELRITEPRGPCATLTRRWMRPALLAEVKSTGAAGWYNAVQTPGRVQAGDSVRLIERVQEEWSLARVFHLLEDRVVSGDALRRLIKSPVAHDAMRERLTRRLWTPGRTDA